MRVTWRSAVSGQLKSERPTDIYLAPWKWPRIRSLKDRWIVGGFISEPRSGGMMRNVCPVHEDTSNLFIGHR